jgi:hypothetical protein
MVPSRTEFKAQLANIRYNRITFRETKSQLHARLNSDRAEFHSKTTNEFFRPELGIFIDFASSDREQSVNRRHSKLQTTKKCTGQTRSQANSGQTLGRAKAGSSTLHNARAYYHHETVRE